MVPHTLVVDFAIALLITSLLCDVLAGIAEESELWTVGSWTLLFGCIAAALSVLSGYAAARSADPTGEALRVVTLHRNAGIVTLLVAIPLAGWRFRSGTVPPRHPAYWLLQIVLIGALVTAAYLGGVSVFRHGVGVLGG